MIHRRYITTAAPARQHLCHKDSSLLFNRRESFDLRIAELGNDAGMIGATL